MAQGDWRLVGKDILADELMERSGMNRSNRDQRNHQAPLPLAKKPEAREKADDSGEIIALVVEGKDGSTNMISDYSCQKDYLAPLFEEASERQGKISLCLREAFQSFIELREVEVILFESMPALDLAKAFLAHPMVLKPILAACNIAARAIERDIGVVNLDTYAPRLSKEVALSIAGYIKPFLPPCVEIPSLTLLDRTHFLDKEIRAKKGNWETLITKTLNENSVLIFKKRKFQVDNNLYELDAAAPSIGEIRIGIDIKRIEARRDIHKRCDEIVNKAAKLKSVLPNAKFAAVIYYPFTTEHTAVSSRLRSHNIDAIVFAGDSADSVTNNVLHLLSELQVKAPNG